MRGTYCPCLQKRPRSILRPVLQRCHRCLPYPPLPLMASSCFHTCRVLRVRAAGEKLGATRVPCESYVCESYEGAVWWGGRSLHK